MLIRGRVNHLVVKQVDALEHDVAHPTRCKGSLFATRINGSFWEGVVGEVELSLFDL